MPKNTERGNMKGVSAYCNLYIHNGCYSLTGNDMQAIATIHDDYNVYGLSYVIDMMDKGGYPFHTKVIYGDERKTL